MQLTHFRRSGTQRGAYRKIDSACCLWTTAGCHCDQRGPQRLRGASPHADRHNKVATISRAQHSAEICAHHGRWVGMEARLLVPAVPGMPVFAAPTSASTPQRQTRQHGAITHTHLPGIAMSKARCSGAMRRLTLKDTSHMSRCLSCEKGVRIAPLASFSLPTGTTSAGCCQGVPGIRNMPLLV